jgi:hypothetical protein
MDILSKKSFFRMLLCFLFLFPIVGEAGILKSGIKSIVVTKIVKKAAKKVAAKQAARTVSPIIKNELNVVRYGSKKNFRTRGLDYHHIPSAKQMEAYGVKAKDGVSVGMEHGRHTLTRTHGHLNKDILIKGEKPREALARDIKNQRSIYRNDNLYDKSVRESLKETIKLNKELHPTLFKKP